MHRLGLDDGLRIVRQLGRAERWLAVLVTQTADARPAVSVVNAGVLVHPVTGAAVVALVARGGTAKIAHLRHTPSATLVFRHGWEWIAVTGPAELAGPDDPLTGLPSAAVPGLLRDIYTAAGGVHDDLATYDAVMAAERRTAVLVTPRRFTANPPGTEHQEHG